VNGANALLATLAANGVTTCFANPGTSEMHFVAGLDESDVRAVLCLFEGVATGAADGYARVSGRPAATLLHLGPGLGNGWANLHNARRAHSPIVNIVGDHATYHAALDAPLQSDIGALASALEGWYRRSENADDVAGDVAAAIEAAMGPPGRVATLVLTADASWSDVSATSLRVREPETPASDPAALARVVELLGPDAALVVGGRLDAETLALAARVCQARGARLFMETFPAIVERGAGVVEAERLIYLSEFAIHQLADVRTLVLVGAPEPVGFFAYPNVPSRLVNSATEVIELVGPGHDAAAALGRLVEMLNAPAPTIPSGTVPPRPRGELNARSVADALGATLPEGVIVADESNTSGVHFFGATRFAPRHRWMTLTGGAIGYGLPVAVGAAIASGTRVLALESDGSMMYTPQALWTMARENLDVTVVALANGRYAILDLERQRVGAVGAGAPSEALFDLDRPRLDLAALARAQGVHAESVDSAEALADALDESYARPGPSFIEVRMPPAF
jgi:acetolactate synthase I/II/III large subunit